jgi:hypothetical protein
MVARGSGKPALCQGASLAIESAVELARCLRDLPDSHAFTAYENLRRDRVTRIITLAARMNSHKAAGPVARRLRDVIMPIAMKLAKPEKTAWQYNHHIEWEAPVSDPATNDQPVPPHGSSPPRSASDSDECERDVVESAGLHRCLP